ncbi:MAG: ECF-type sigma factor [Pirellulaceae bacterium]
MVSSGSVTGWFHALTNGESSAAEKLWMVYFSQMTQIARNRIKRYPVAAFDEEDVAISAFGVFYQAIRMGKFDAVDSRDDLWRLLATITIRKANDYLKREAAEKRGGLGGTSHTIDGQGLASRNELSDPQFAAIMKEQCEELLSCLPNDEVRCVALARLQGQTVEEIAGSVQASQRSVYRMLSIIRNSWLRKFDLH